MRGSGLALLGDEQLLFRQNPHTLLLLAPLLLLSIAFLAFALVFCPSTHTLSLTGRCLPLAALAVLVTAGLVFLD